ncbi:MAG TPA: TetR/AcrR family transcriptional regulator C-terminal domain-containing protein [Devosiaceae bacterium]
MATTLDIGDRDLTERQKAVLTAALDVLVDAGDRLTMTEVARRASCSKETLYKWFGDRDGLLTATVQWQAAKVRAPIVDRQKLNRESLSQSLHAFGRDLLTVLTGDISVALNRLAVAHAGADKRDLGRVVLENGRIAMGRRLKPVLEAGREAGLLRFEDAEQAFRTYFGLVVRDVQIRLLLGDRLKVGGAEIDREAATAADQFLALYGA